MQIPNVCQASVPRFAVVTLFIITIITITAGNGSGSDGTATLPFPSPLPIPEQNGPVTSPPDTLGDTLNPVQ